MKQMTNLEGERTKQREIKRASKHVGDWLGFLGAAKQEAFATAFGTDIGSSIIHNTMVSFSPASTGFYDK